MVAIVTTVRRSIQFVARFHLYEITSNFQRNNVEGEGEWKTVKAKGEWRWCLTVLCRALAHASAHYWQAISGDELPDKQDELRVASRYILVLSSSGQVSS